MSDVFHPDFSDAPERLPFLGPFWLAQLFERLPTIQETKFPKIPLSNLRFISMFEWVSTVAVIDELLKSKSEVGIDLVGDDHLFFVADYDDLRNASRISRITEEHARRSWPKHKIYSFLESLGTRNVLRLPTGTPLYPFFSKSPAYYSDGNATVLLNLSRISEPKNCSQFVDAGVIQQWRDQMALEFPESPLLENGEIWKVFCREMAVNIVEHSGKTGFLGARIIRNPTESPWCKMAFSKEVQQLFPLMKDGFVELCAADVGHGIVNTLRDSLLKQHAESHTTTTSVDSIDERVLLYAFDEFGTSKTDEESWNSKRHALNRMLNIVAKYGGAITVRSGRSEVVFATKGGSFKRLPDRLGFVPTTTRRLASNFLGTHLQIVLPLFPNSTYSRIDRPSVLRKPLPAAYKLDDKHVQGHLVPLKEALDLDLESIGKHDAIEFSKACNRLIETLKEQNREEALVFDFSDMELTEVHFETFVTRMENLFSNRLVLLVELDPFLAASVKRLEQERVNSFLVEARDRGEDEYNRNLVHAPILGCDRHGKSYIFGVSDLRIENALLDLLDRPCSRANLMSKLGPESIPLFGSILDASNPLFQLVDDGRVSDKRVQNPDDRPWRLAWTSSELKIETSRVMTRHFDKVIERCRAWRGRRYETTASEMSTIRDTGSEIFNLSWQTGDTWLEEFFETAQILSRGRLADEAAQRLIFRLKKWLESQSLTLDHVNVLACVNASALLLANAIRKWWPLSSKPAIADLGYYVMQREPTIPVLSNQGKCYVIVQDLFHKGFVSNQLVKLLRDQKKVVLCKIALAEFSDSTTTEATLVDDWKDSKLVGADDNLNDIVVPYHAMIRVPAPRERRRPSPGENCDPHWVEPRTLRPISLRQLRHERNIGQSTNSFIKKEPFFDDVFAQNIMSAGHYVHGSRHYTIAIDIEKAVRGKLGEKLASWVADVCSGAKREINAVHWESERGCQLDDDVTVMLMPLHSQIHYLWPSIEERLRARGRRQPAWYLDATLFTGWGPSYRIPIQLENLISTVVQAAIIAEADKSRTSWDAGITILILDDATVSGRTLETVIAAILRSVHSAYALYNYVGTPRLSPIKWVRYFSIFNQLSHSRNDIWRNMSHIGAGSSIPFVFESFGHFFGIPSFSAQGCPKCSKEARFRSIRSKAKQLGLPTAVAWIDKGLVEVTPKSIDSPNFERADSKELDAPINVLSTQKRNNPDSRFVIYRTDSAIWRFYSLMYLSYPPGDLLRQLNIQKDESSKADASEYRRYRWAVYDWCIRNWSRMIATSSRRDFMKCVLLEFEFNTRLLPHIFEAISEIHTDPYIRVLVGHALQSFLVACLDDSKSADVLKIRIEESLNLFLLSIDDDLVHEVRVIAAPKVVATIDDDYQTVDQIGNVPQKILHVIDDLANDRRQSSLNSLRNMHLRFTQPRGYVKPQWALRVVCENLFRGRDGTEVRQHHQLLLALLNDVQQFPASPTVRHALHNSLGLFVAALKDLSLVYAAPSVANSSAPDRTGRTQILSDCDEVMNWLAEDINSLKSQVKPSALSNLQAALDLKAKFTTWFNENYHQSLSEIITKLKESASHKDPMSQLDFQVSSDSGLHRLRVLTFVNRFSIFLENWLIDPIVNRKGDGNRYKSGLTICVDNGNLIRFRLLTSFDSLEMTQKNTTQGRNYGADQGQLRSFGVNFSENWTFPTSHESELGYLAAYECFTPAGFLPRGVL